MIGPQKGQPWFIQTLLLPLCGLTGNFKNKPDLLSTIKALQLSRSTVTQRCEVMAKDLTQQLQRVIADCKCFSLQLDESTDTSDTAQMCIFIWMVFTDMTEEESY